jgi:3-oxoacyl-(acyl-carrier-protein) synthase
VDPLRRSDCLFGLFQHLPRGLQGHIHALFSAAGSAGSLVGATASGLLYAVEPGVPLLAEGILYLIVALTLTALQAMACLSSLVRIGHAVDLVSEESLE